jgi:MscS family membrane protein
MLSGGGTRIKDRHKDKYGSAYRCYNLPLSAVALKTMNLRRHKIAFSKFTSLSFLVFFLSLVSIPVNSLAQAVPEEDLEEEALAEESALRDNLGRDTPYSSFRRFIEATEEFDYETAAEYIDRRNLPHDVRRFDGPELARQLDFIIQRGMSINIELLSKRASGQVVDGLPDYRDELGTLVSDEGEQVLYMQRVPGVDDNFIWKVSNASIALVPELYDFFKYPEWVERVREKIPPKHSFLGVESFKWVIVLSMAAILYPVFWLIGYIISRLVSKRTSPLHKQFRKFLTGPIAVLTLMMILGHLLKELGLGARAQAIMETRTLATLVTVWLIFSLIDLLRAKRREHFIAQGRTDAHVLGRPFANALKLITLLAATLVWLNNSGVEIGALLAGLGIGGVALALALQKPIEDLLGAVSIYSQQPIQAGDLCKYGNILGSIEEIGLRTTRIRTLNDTLVSVPNCIIAHGAIENYSARRKMLYDPDLPLRYDTSAEQMNAIIADIDAMARAHEKVIEDSVRIRFTQFAPNAMIIKARIYVDEDDFSHYLKVVDELNLAIMDIVQGHGAHFAQGATTVMLESTAQAQLPAGS